MRSHDTQENDIQHNDTANLPLKRDTQHSGSVLLWRLSFMPGVMYNECQK
jgi:hypothetical protein